MYSNQLIAKEKNWEIIFCKFGYNNLQGKLTFLAFFRFKKFFKMILIL